MSVDSILNLRTVFKCPNVGSGKPVDIVECLLF